MNTKGSQRARKHGCSPKRSASQTRAEQRRDVTESVNWTRAGVLAQAETLVSAREVLFPIRFTQPVMKPMLRLEEHKLIHWPKNGEAGT